MSNHLDCGVTALKPRAKLVDVAKKTVSRAVPCGGRTEDNTPCERPIIRHLYKRRCKPHMLFGTNGPIAWWIRDRQARDQAVLDGTEPAKTRRDYRRVAKATADEEWRTEVRRRGRQLVGRKLWDDFAGNLGISTCGYLADVADGLVKVRRAAQDAMGVVVDAALAGRPKLVHKVAAKCIEKFVDLKLGGVAGMADALRIVGVYVCVLRGRSLRRCRCLKQLAKSQGPSLVKQALRQQLPDIADKA